MKEQGYFKAHKRIKAVKGFYSHLSFYCTIIPVIIFVNLKYEPNFHWFWFSTLGWGLGLFCHWMRIFGFNLLGFGQNWEDKKIRQLIEEEEEVK